jgi:hypothetical protein
VEEVTVATAALSVKETNPSTAAESASSAAIGAKGKGKPDQPLEVGLLVTQYTCACEDLKNQCPVCETCSYAVFCLLVWLKWDIVARQEAEKKALREANKKAKKEAKLQRVEKNKIAAPKKAKVTRIIHAA